MKTEEKKKLEMPPKILRVTIGVGEIQNDYEINLPKNGQRIDIEAAKVRITGGTSRDLISGSNTAQDAWLLSEAIATFSILIPKLRSDFAVDLMDLDALQSKLLIKAYQKFYEWDQAWWKFINQDVEEDEVK